MNRPSVRRSAVAVVAVLAVAACGSTAPEDTDEYRDLLDDYNQVDEELADTRQELADANAANVQLDDDLAAAQSELADVAERADSGQALLDDFTEILTVDLVARAGLDRTDAECVTGSFLTDGDLRASYLVLISPAGADDQEIVDASFDQLTAAMRGCGVDVPEADDGAAAPVPDLPPLEEVLGEVEVTGDWLPLFEEGSDAAIAMSVPVLVGADYDGNPVRVDPANDGPTMIVFLAHWCPHCNAEVPKIIQLGDDGLVPDGVNIVAVSTGVNPDAPNYPPGEWLESAGWIYPVLADGIDAETGRFAAADAYGLRSYPFVVLADGGGKVTATWSGERTIDELAAALASLATG